MADEDTTKEPTPPPEEKRSLVPTILAIAAVCAVVALLFLWPGGGGSGPEGATDRDGAGGPRGGQASERTKRAGVQARGYDEAKGSPGGRVNPAVKLPNVGMAPGPAPGPEEPPEFKSAEEEIAWYEKKLEQAKANLEMRTLAMQRLDGARERAEQSADPQEALRVFEGRKERVEDNHRRAEEKVKELEQKLAELRRGKK
jgi:hypothetical protein